MSDVVEISRQIGMLQQMMAQEEETHREIMQELVALKEQIGEHGEKLTVLYEKADEPSVTADINRILDIIKRRAAIAVMMSGAVGLIVGGASAGEIGSALKQILLAMSQ